MREDYYADYYEFENNNWWFVSRRRILKALLNRHLPSMDAERIILDAGCGTGINLLMLDTFGCVTGADQSEEAVRFCAQRGRHHVKQADVTNLPFEHSSFDLVTALDVLEHIEEDDKAVQELARVCKPGGFVLVTVPVFPSLWGEHDVINQHVRRYEPRVMLQLLESNGFEIQHQSFMNTLLLPAAFLWRWWRKLSTSLSPKKDRQARADNMHHHPLMNALLTLIYSVEKPFVVRWGIPLGLSLIVLARKK